jgi:hypothetical protein
MHYLGTVLVPRSFFEDQLFSINEEVPTLLKKKKNGNKEKIVNFNYVFIVTS